MVYEANDYEHLLGIDGFSTELMHDHLSLYRGHVRSTNILIAALEEVLCDAAS